MNMQIKAPKAFAQRRQLGEILEFRNEIIHPKDNPSGKATFVGLEHIERDTGVRIGSMQIELSKMTGRRARFQSGDIVYGYLRPYLNKVWIAEFDGICSVDQYVFTVNSRHDRNYVAHFLRSSEFLKTAPIDSAPGQLPRIRSGEIAATLIPIPSLDEQRRIAEILDKADALRGKHKRALELIDGLKQATFLDIFGDPAANPRNYPLVAFGDIAEKISDGPFGSNLKSSHYTPEGIRVIRLQNIGSDDFIDKDRAFISQEHFKILSKHECLPGDILIGTLGEPNLRACIQPAWISRALNKADCVQMRADPNKAIREYVVTLINQPSVEAMAHSSIMGQTRARISMGRFRDLYVPIAPLEKQKRFGEIYRKLKADRMKLQAAAKSLDALFSSLQHYAFSGQL